MTISRHKHKFYHTYLANTIGAAFVIGIFLSAGSCAKSCAKARHVDAQTRLLEAETRYLETETRCLEYELNEDEFNTRDD